MICDHDTKNYLYSSFWLRGHCLLLHNTVMAELLMTENNDQDKQKSYIFPQIETLKNSALATYNTLNAHFPNG